MWFAEEMPRSRPAEHAGGEVAARGRGLPARLRRGQPARGGHPAALLQRARARHRHAAVAGPSRCPSCPTSSASTPASSSSTRATSSASMLFVLAAPGARRSTTWPATASCPGARWPPSAASRSFPLPPYFTPLAIAPLRRLGVLDLPLELLELLRFGRGVDNRRLKPAGFRYEHTSAGDGGALLAGGAAAPDPRRAASPASCTSATSRTSSATPPPSCGRARTCDVDAAGRRPGGRAGGGR